MASRSIRRAQIPIRALGSDKCSHHRGKELLYHCETCNKLACSDCVFSTHQGHKLNSLEHVIPSKKDQIQDYVRKAEKSLLPQYKSDIEFTDTKIKRYEDHFCHLISDIQERGKYLKMEIDQMTKQMVDICTGMKTENIEMLNQYKQELEDLHTAIKHQVEQCKSALNQGTNVQIYDTERNIQDNPVTPPSPSPRNTEFQVPVLLPSELTKQLGDLYGALTNIEDQGHKSDGQTPTYDDENASDMIASLRTGNLNTTEMITLEEMDTADCKKVDLDDITSEFQYIFHEDVEITSAFRNNYGSRSRCSICPTQNNCAWMIQGGNARRAYLLSQKGEVKKAIKLPFSQILVSTTEDNDCLWVAHYKQGTVYKIQSSNQMQTCFTVSGLRNFYICKDKTVVAVTESKIIRFNQHGQMLYETCQQNLKYVYLANYLAECPITGNIAATGNVQFSAYNVLTVVNDKFEFLFQCNNEVKAEDEKPQKFDPSDICYDGQGNLLVIDTYSLSVLLLNGKGHLLKKLLHAPHVGYIPENIGINRNVVWVYTKRLWMLLLKYRT